MIFQVKESDTNVSDEVKRCSEDAEIQKTNNSEDNIKR